MVRISPRIQFFEIADQGWFPDYLRRMVQSDLTLAWTFKAPFQIQKTAPAKLVANTLYRTLSSSVGDYTYVDFCAGAGGPTPYIEKDLNSQLMTRAGDISTGPNGNSCNGENNNQAIKFVLTDLHPHLPEWTAAARNSKHLTFISKPVDATNAPRDLVDQDGKKTFRLFNLAFHHFDDKLGTAILRNTLDTADGFGIFELQDRTISSMITITAMGILMFLITPFYFWRSPGHLFFTYIVPIIPFVLVFDGYVSSLRTRSPGEVKALMEECGASSDGWVIKSGEMQHTWPTGYMSYFIGIKE